MEQVAEFFEALTDAGNPFVRNAMLMAILGSIAAGVIGSYVVSRRITYIAGSIAHCVLGGIGAAHYAQDNLGWAWCDPMYGAIVAALLAAVIIALVTMRAGQREDTVIGAVWAVGMAMGLLFMYHTEGYRGDLHSYLFGNIVMVGSRDLWMVLVLDVVVIAVGLLLYNRFVAVCFDEEFARVRGLNVEAYYVLLLCLTALTVVVLVSVVGVVMVIALLTLPAALGGYLSRTLSSLMVVASVCAVVLSTGGLTISYVLDWPAGPTMIVLAGGAYLLAVAGHGIIQRCR